MGAYRSSENPERDNEGYASVSDDFLADCGDEQQLVEKLKSRDRPSWAYLLDRDSQKLHRAVVKMLVSRGYPTNWGEEITQQVWKAAIAGIGEFTWRGDGSLYAWLQGIARNRVRKQGNRKDNHHFSLDNLIIADDDHQLDRFYYDHDLIGSNPEAIVIEREQIRTVIAAMEELSPRDREIVIQRFIYDAKPQELAAIYKIEASSVSVVLSRAKKAIRAHAKRNGGSGNGTHDPKE